jgi:hypothetical protein
MTKIEQLVAMLRQSMPDKADTEILADLLSRGVVHHGYAIDESVELESNIGTPRPARLVKRWVVLKAGRPEFSTDSEQEAVEYLKAVQAAIAVS